MVSGPTNFQKSTNKQKTANLLSEFCTRRADNALLGNVKLEIADNLMEITSTSSRDIRNIVPVINEIDSRVLENKETFVK